MRNEFGATKVLIVVAVLVCAILLIAHMHEQVTAADLPFPSGLLWPIEIITYALAVVIWTGRWTARSLGIGVPGMVAVRFAICLGAAALGQLSGRATADKAGLLAVANSGICWIIAIIFAMLIWHPMRSFLVPRSTRRRRRPLVTRQHSLGVTGGVAESQEEDPGARSDEGYEQGEELIPVAAGPGGEPLPTYGLSAVETGLEGEVMIPLRVILSQLPAERLSPKASTMEAQQVILPLQLLASGLREGEIALPLRRIIAETSGSLDSGLGGLLLQSEDGATDQSPVVIPLEMVVSQVPDETWELPDREPPAWLQAAEEEEAEQFAFAER